MLFVYVAHNLSICTLKNIYNSIALSNSLIINYLIINSKRFLNCTTRQLILGMSWHGGSVFVLFQELDNWILQFLRIQDQHGAQMNWDHNPWIYTFHGYPLSIQILHVHYQIIFFFVMEMIGGCVSTFV